MRIARRMIDLEATDEEILEVVSVNAEELAELHKEMNCICYENKAMGIYFIADPDGYWLEIVPTR